MNIQINGIDLHYAVAGEGKESIVILPGWGATSAVYTLMIKQLSEVYTVYTLDLPGFGITPEPPVAWSIDDYARLVMDFLQACGLTSVILMGHSYGGRIIINLCNRDCPFTISRVVLIDSAGIKTPLSAAQQKKQKKYARAKKFYQTKLMRTLFPNAIRNLQNRFGSADYAAASPIMKQTLVKAVTEDYTDILPGVTPPTLLIWGDRDTATPISDAYTMHRAISGSRLEVIEGAGHFPFVDQPFEFMKILRTHFDL